MTQAPLSWTFGVHRITAFGNVSLGYTNAIATDWTFSINAVLSPAFRADICGQMPMLLGKMVGYTLGLSSGKKPSSLIRLRPNRGYSTPSSTPSTALQSLDLLQTYRGLVELGKIQSNDNQIRVVMQVRLLMTRSPRQYAVFIHCSSGSYRRS